MKLRGGLFLLLLTACAGTALGDGGGEGGGPDGKVFVCKYVGTPGVDERLQTGQNPISVSVNAIPLGDVQIGSEFADAQGRSVVIAFDIGQPEPSPDACPPPHGGGTTTTTKPDHSTTTTKPGHDTTTTVKATTTTAKATTTTQPHQTTTTQPGGGSTTTTQGGGGTTTTFPTPRQFSFPSVTAVCPPGATRPVISITFPNRPDLDGDSGILDFSDGTSYGVLVFQSGQTITIPYPASNASPLTLTYRIMGETATATVTFPNCLVTTTTGAPTSTTTSTTTTTTPTTTTSGPSTSTSTTTTSSTSTTDDDSSADAVRPVHPDTATNATYIDNVAPADNIATFRVRRSGDGLCR